MRLELYHLWDCPYSTRVRDFVERNRMRAYVQYKDVDDERGAEDRLIELSGTADVLCLMVNDHPVQGSDEIIRWLRHYFLGDRAVPSLG